MSTRRLILIEASEKDWSIDERTKEIAKEGLAAARLALRQARPADRAAA